MSTPDLKDAEVSPSETGESSSFLKWLLVAGAIVALAAGLILLIRVLPTEVPAEDGSLAFPIPTQPKGPPGRVVLTEDTTYNFGILPQHSKGTHTWVLKNEGEGELELRKGPADCSCTIASLKDEKAVLKLPPGESTEITLGWETREFDGKIHKSATINILGDPERSAAVFTIEGTVRPAVTVMPKERVLSFGDVPSDTTSKSKFAIASADHPDLKIVSMTSSRPGMVEMTAMPLPDSDRKGLEWEAMKGGYLVEVELQKTKDLGVFNEEIIVTTDHPNVKEVRLSVGGRRSGPISVIPDAARLHNVRSEDGESLGVMILVRNAPDTKFEVAKKPDNVKVEIVPSDVRTGSAAKIRQYRMTVTVPPGTPPGLIQGEISLKSDHPQASQLTVPVDITVLGGN